jgi:hypothetical protein
MKRSSETLFAVLVSTVLLAVGATVINAAEMLSGGTFANAGGHKASGAVAIVKDGDMTKLVLKDDFQLQSAPDAKLGFGKDGYVQGSIFAALEKLEGAQEYVIPAGTDLSEYNEIWIWCQKFNVPLGVAKLN